MGVNYYNIIKSSNSILNGVKPFPDTPSPSFAKKSIKVICQTYNLSIDEVLSELNKAGFVIQVNDTVKEIGTNNKSNPMVIFEIIKEIANKNQ